MIKQLKFVQGAVSKQTFNPTLTHFNIQNGTITGCNGWLTIQAPLPVDICAAPKAADFVKAVSACEGTMSLHMTPACKLAVCADGFKSYIECVNASNFPALPTIDESLMHPVAGNFMDMISTLAPFVNEDETAAHNWTNSIIISPEGHCFATNNVVLVQIYTGVKFPISENLCIPHHTIQELLRIKEKPTDIGWDSKGIMFRYGGGMFMHTTLRTSGADIDINSMFPQFAPCPPVPEDMFAALKKIKPFVDEAERVYMRGNGLHTDIEEGIGTSVQMANCPQGVRGFTHRHLVSLQGVARTMDFSRESNKPCVFYGDMLRGLIMGMI